MKFKILSFVLLWAAAATAETFTQLVVWSKSGEKMAYTMTEAPKITFEGDNLAVSVGKDTTAYIPVDNISHFSYDTVEQTTGIDAAIEGDEGLGIADGALQFALNEGRNDIAIYTLDGTTVYHAVVSDAATHTFPLSRLAEGIYIVKVNSLTYKLLKR